MKNIVLAIMLILWTVGMFLVNVTLSSQDYRSVLVIAIIAQIIVIGIFISKYKSIGVAWKIAGGILSVSAVWAILNATMRLVNL